MKTALVLAIVLAMSMLSYTAFAADTVKTGQSYSCPRSIAVEVTMKSPSAASGWEAIPAKSTFTLAITENAVRGEAMICHYTNGTVDYNLAKSFPKGKTCYLAPNQGFMCQ
ncbi:MAG: hypothetical protein ABFD12_12955 [Syntrophorhabdus sp.]